MPNQPMRFEFNPPPPGKVVKPAVIGFLVILALLAAVKSFYTVEPSEKAVVLRFGRYLETSEPGPHFCIPFVDEVLIADIRERSIRLPWGTEGNERPTRSVSDDNTLILTGDLNAAAVEWSLQWRVSNPREYLFTFHTEDVDQEVLLRGIITVVTRTVMNRLIGDYSIDEVLTEKRTEIGELAGQAAQELLDDYKCGIQITALQMQRVTPPEQVRGSFEMVNTAVQKREQYENEANKLRNELIPKAQAERDKAIREAEGYAARRRAESRGEIEALLARYDAYSEAKDVTRERLYLETMEKVLSGVKNKTIIDADLRQWLPLLELNKGDN